MGAGRGAGAEEQRREVLLAHFHPSTFLAPIGDIGACSGFVRLRGDGLSAALFFFDTLWFLFPPLTAANECPQGAILKLLLFFLSDLGYGSLLRSRLAIISCRHSTAVVSWARSMPISWMLAKTNHGQQAETMRHETTRVEPTNTFTCHYLATITCTGVSNVYAIERV